MLLVELAAASSGAAQLLSGAAKPTRLVTAFGFTEASVVCLSNA